MKFPPKLLLSPFKIYTLLFLLNPFATPISHYTTALEFSEIDSNNDIIYQGDAYASNQGIQLKGDKYESVGRAIYREPMHLWDYASRNLADFNTHFSFVINSQGNFPYGNGFALFLAPNNSIAGSFGLVSENETLKYSFVAVEFDTNSDSWDYYDGKHVGIDVNSTQSRISTPWLWSDIENGKRAEAWISYDSSSKNIILLLTDDDDYGAALSSGNYTSLSYTIDLSENLPEWVTFGFSGSTNGSSFEIHDIITWNFSSSLQTSQTKNYSTPVFTSPPTPISWTFSLESEETDYYNDHDPERRKNKTWLWVVLGVVQG